MKDDYNYAVKASTYVLLLSVAMNLDIATDFLRVAVRANEKKNIYN